MNYKILVIALIACAFVTLPVIAAHYDTYYESKYTNENSVSPVHIYSEYGYVIFKIRAGGSAEDRMVFILNNAMPKKPTFESMFYPDRTHTNKDNPMWLQVEVLPDGESVPVVFAPGTYTAYLRNSNNLEMESYQFKVNPGRDTSFVTFRGQAV